MRITKNLLYKFANETVKQRNRSEPDIHAAYLMGSVLTDEPLLGGTTDIDLVLVHRYLAPASREIVSITPEISLDIYHKTQDDYEQIRQFRQDPWMGYPLTYNHILLFDTDHWLEYVQSSVTAEFHREDNVLARVHVFLSAARDRWRNLSASPPQNHLVWLDQYLHALSLGANAICGLIGPPLSTRRFMMTFTQRLESLGTSEVRAGFCGLMGCLDLQSTAYDSWLAAFEQDLIHVSQMDSHPAHLSPCRHGYYVQAFQALAQSGDPTLLSWPLLRTWLDIQLALDQESPGHETWQGFLETLKLTEGVSEEKTEALDSYLDHLDVLIETWADTYGF
jgi:hypothetical protein